MSKKLAKKSTLLLSVLISCITLYAPLSQAEHKQKNNQENKMSNTNKPTFVMVHSAWMGGWSLEHVRNGLTAKGYASAAPDLPAHGQDKTPVADVSMAAYVKTVTDVIDKVKGQVILVGHSFGGVIASQVAEERPDKIKAINYLCAFMLPNGASFMDATQGVKHSNVLNNLYFSEDKLLVGIKEEALHEAVAHDVPEAAFLAAKPYLVLEPTRPLGEKLKLTDNRYGQVPRFYTQCTKDNAIPLDVQNAMIEQSPVVKTYQLPSSHAPIFSMPDKVVEVLVDVAELTQ
jgi:pimeloyl-ACP methyl ester carboxylesterase